MFSHPNSSSSKRKPFVDLTNMSSDNEETLKSDKKYENMDMMPLISHEKAVTTDIVDDTRFQNVHPLLGWYKHDLLTGILSYDSFMQLMNPDNDLPLMNLLTEIGVIADSNQCLLCGGQMKKSNYGAHWVWLCNRRVNGVKCNKGKKSVRTGTIFGNSNLSVQEILQVIWHFVHHLSEKQCVEYTKISSKNNTTIVKWYRFCREVCTTWFWNPVNTPKLGGYGKIVEMDESFFPGHPKYNKGRRLGEYSWQDHEKWAFGLTERGSLDVIIKQYHRTDCAKI